MDPGTGIEDMQLVFSGLRMDLVRHRAFLEDQEIALTPTEFRLVECFLRQPNRVLTRCELIEAAVRAKSAVGDRTIDQHIRCLRRKLQRPNLINTVSGCGYCLGTPPPPDTHE